MVEKKKEIEKKKDENEKLVKTHEGHDSAVINIIDDNKTKFKKFNNNLDELKKINDNIISQKSKYSTDANFNTTYQNPINDIFNKNNANKTSIEQINKEIEILQKQISEHNKKIISNDTSIQGIINGLTSLIDSLTTSGTPATPATTGSPATPATTSSPATTGSPAATGVPAPAPVLGVHGFSPVGSTLATGPPINQVQITNSPEWIDIKNILTELTNKINNFIIPTFTASSLPKAKTSSFFSLGGNKTKKYKLQNHKKHKKSKKNKLLEDQKGGSPESDEIILLITQLKNTIETNSQLLKINYGTHSNFSSLYNTLINQIQGDISVLKLKLSNFVTSNPTDPKSKEITVINSNLVELIPVLQDIIIQNIPQNIPNFNVPQLNQKMIGIIIMNDFTNFLISLINQNGQPGFGFMGQPGFMGQQGFMGQPVLMGQPGFGQPGFGQQNVLQNFIQQQQQQGTTGDSTQVLATSIYGIIRQLLTSFLPRILTALKSARKQILEQVSEFSKLNKKFKEMDEKQKEIVKIQSKIKIKQIESSKIYVQIEEMTSAPKKTLEEILADPISKKMLKIAENKTPLLDKDIWKSFVNDIVANQSSFGLSSPNQLPNQSTGMTQQGQQVQQPSMFALPSQQGQQGQQINGLIQPDYRVFGFSKQPSPNLIQQINSIPFDLNEPTNVNKTINYFYNQIYEKLKQNPSQPEFATFLATINNREDIFKKHPYGLLILTSPIGLDWVEYNPNGNKLIPWIIPNLSFGPILQEKFGSAEAQSRISRLNLIYETLQKKTAQDQAVSQQAIQQAIQQQALGTGIQQMMKPPQVPQ